MFCFVGGYDCECPKNYRINGKQCDDIDECLLHPDICHRETSYCHNIPGDYECVCKPGFKDDGTHKNCIDIDECHDHNGGCSHHCTNTYGSFQCSCDKGYELSHDKKTCIDIDECTKYGHQHLCSKETSICINTPGSYHCDCKIGFRDDGTHKTCVDINECIEHTHRCQQNCLNTFGSYRCGCHQGYRLVDTHRLITIFCSIHMFIYIFFYSNYLGVKTLMNVMKVKSSIQLLTVVSELKIINRNYVMVIVKTL